MENLDDIYRQYSKQVYGYLLSITKNHDLAEELTQETDYSAFSAPALKRGQRKGIGI